MNNHLNIFNSYTKDERITQLENDLTRGLALTLLEDQLFLNTFLGYVLNKKKGGYCGVFDDFDGKKEIEIDIQKKVSSIKDVDHIFAVSISECDLQTDSFFNQSNNKEYDPITDLLITLSNVAIIVEVKPNYQDCTGQLFNQALNASEAKTITSKEVTPVDFNWKKVMEKAVQIHNFQKATNNSSRFLNDFIQYVQGHNFNWLPQAALASLDIKGASGPIYSRIDTAIKQSVLRSLENKRLGFECDKSWADEILFSVNKENESIDLRIYPGNTKNQGWNIFSKDGEPLFKKEVSLGAQTFPIIKNYHTKLTSFQKYFTSIDFKEDNLKQALYTRENFITYSGRKKRDNGDWDKLENLFDAHFKEDFDWKKDSSWKEKVRESGKSQFDISFGYELIVNIPYKTFQEKDKNKEDLSDLVAFIEEINSEFSALLMK
jgi:hypothetical protein